VSAGILLTGITLPATTPEALEKIAAVQTVLMRAEQIGLKTEHILHGGMYVRTVTLPPEVIITGSLIKRATMLIINGHCEVFVGDGWAELDGYNVIPASAGRKQIFVSLGTVAITMIFPTQAQTIREAEEEIFAEADLLLSRRQDNDTVIVTGE
jgi:hypothetical protein